MSPEPRTSHLSQHLPRHVAARWYDWALLLVLAVLALVVVNKAQRVMAADWWVASARPQMVAWSEKKTPVDNAQWQTVHRHYRYALELAPDNPSLHDDMAALYVMGARSNPVGSAPYLALYEMAAEQQVTALSLRPAHGWTWASLADTMYALQPLSADSWLAWRKAKAYAPHELLVQATLVFLARDAGPLAPPDVVQWLAHTELHAPSTLRNLVDRYPARGEPVTEGLSFTLAKVPQ